MLVCCAGNPGVSGFVYDGETPLAVYFAEPTGMINYPLLHLGIAIGRWGDDSVATDRLRVVFSSPSRTAVRTRRSCISRQYRTYHARKGAIPCRCRASPNMAELRTVAKAIIESDPRLG